MKKIRKSVSLAVAFTGVALVTGCSEEALDPAGNLANEYVKSFIEKYGVPEAGHDFSMAKLGTVTVRTDRPTDIRIVGSVEGKNYEFDRAYGVEGEKTLTFDAPRDVNYVSVIANDIRAYTARLGGVVSIDCPRQSRVNEGTDTKITVTADNSETVEYQMKSVSNGMINPTGYKSDKVYNGHTDNGFAYHMLGSEMIQYIGAANTTYTGDLSSYTGLGSEEYTSRHTNEHINVLNLKLGADDQKIEMGRVYGNNTLLKESTSFLLVPMLFVDKDNLDGQVRSYNYSSDLHQWGHDLTIDYNATSAYTNGIDGGNGGVISSAVLGVNDFAEFRPILNDASLRSDLEKYAAAQKTYNMPLPKDKYGGDRQYADAPLDPYDKDNPIAFYSQWNDYIHAWLNAQTPEVKAQFPDLKFVKEYLALKEVIFKPGAMPSVTKVEEGKFKIEFFDSQVSNSLKSYGASFTDLVDPEVTYNIEGSYRVNLVGENDKDIVDHLGTEFCYYVRDVNHPEKGIVTTTDKDRIRTIHRHSSYTAYNGEYNDWEHKVFMVDFDNDGVFNDFVFIPHLAVYGNSEYIGWFIAAEDLGSTDDNDFNDMVVGISVSREGNDAQRIVASIRACGGTYPLYLMFDDSLGNTFFVGQEVHKWVGVPTDFMFNTGAVDVREGGIPTAEIVYDLLQQTEEFHIADRANTDMGENSTMGGFWVLVDKNGTLDGKLSLTKRGTTLMTPEIEALIDSDTDIYKVNNDPKYGVNNAVVPQMILVTSNWLWPQERVDIGDAYQNFSKWVTDRTAKWYGSDAEGVDATKVTQPKPKEN